MKRQAETFGTALESRVKSRHEAKDSFELSECDAGHGILRLLSVFFIQPELSDGYLWIES